MESENKMNRNSILHLSNAESNRFTRECITTSFLILLSQKPFEKITVTDITSKAGVSRMAFYRNFQSKENIVSEIASETVKIIDDSLNNPKYSNNPHAWFSDFFQNLSELDGQVINVFKTDALADIILNGNSVFYKFINSKTVFEKYKMVAWAGAVKNILFEWIENGRKESAKDMADICCEIFKP
ncbi:MAG: TetR/AcrR family transcriptional regulator [Acutalibacteraceae bacterium]